MSSSLIVRSLRTLTLASALAGLLAAASQAEEIVVSNYAQTVNGMPYAVAKGLGYFKQEGADVTGILTSMGGGTTIRNAMGGDLAYAETNLPSVVMANQQGAKFKIIGGAAHTVAEFFWIVMPNSPIKKLEDLKGKKTRLHPTPSRPARRSTSCC